LKLTLASFGWIQYNYKNFFVEYDLFVIFVGRDLKICEGLPMKHKLLLLAVLFYLIPVKCMADDILMLLESDALAAAGKYIKTAPQFVDREDFKQSISKRTDTCLAPTIKWKDLHTKIDYGVENVTSDQKTKFSIYLMILGNLESKVTMGICFYEIDKYFLKKGYGKYYIKGFEESFQYRTVELSLLRKFVRRDLWKEFRWQEFIDYGSHEQSATDDLFNEIQSLKNAMEKISDYRLSLMGRDGKKIRQAVHENFIKTPDGKKWLENQRLIKEFHENEAKQEVENLRRQRSALEAQRQANNEATGLNLLGLGLKMMQGGYGYTPPPTLAPIQSIPQPTAPSFHRFTFGNTVIFCNGAGDGFNVTCN
jgi:hypothetical protein